MLLGTRNHTVGDKRRHIVHYTLDAGLSISSVSVTSPSATLTISGAAPMEPRKVVFFTNGGLLNDAVTVSIQITLSNSEIVNDTMAFTVIAP